MRAAVRCRPEVRGLRRRRRPGPAREQKLWPFEHPRQPDESWWSIRHGISRWPAVRFFKAPVPSGCTLTRVESSFTASILRRTICSRCNCSKTRPNTPFLDQRFMRVKRVCQLPKRFGSPRHLHPCSATYNNALSTCRLERLTLPRWRGRLGSIRRYCASVISMNRSIPQNPI